VAAPMVLGPLGNREDSARRFPTPERLFAKLLRRGKPAQDYPQSDGAFRADWVAGMFMFFRSEAYASLGGFDEGFFLYYEDVDLCSRILLQGMSAVVEPAAEVVHEAQRASHRNFRHAWWHLASIGRYFLSDTYEKLRLSGALRR
jgi:N-acetylglucosaminyl-diphospho-decaprenol L-rhamnosyltransferase